MHEVQDGSFLAASEERVWFGQHQNVEVAQIEWVGAIPIGNRAGIGFEAIAACTLKRDSPGANSACPVGFHLRIRILGERIGLAGADDPVGITSSFSVSIVKEHAIDRGCMRRENMLLKKS